MWPWGGTYVLYVETFRELLEQLSCHQKNCVYILEFSCTSISWNMLAWIKDPLKSKKYHLESVQLLLDLLCKHWGKAVAGSNLSSTVVFSTRPGIMELNPLAECSISFGLRCCWDALGVALEPQGRHKVVLAPQGYRSSSSVALWIVRSAGSR